MPNIEAEIAEIRKYFAIWIAEVKTAVGLTYFDINKISEGTCQHLLNLVLDYKLEDFNRKKVNYPGIDLGTQRKQNWPFKSLHALTQESSRTASRPSLRMTI